MMRPRQASTALPRLHDKTQILDMRRFRSDLAILTPKLRDRAEVPRQESFVRKTHSLLKGAVYSQEKTCHCGLPNAQFCTLHLSKADVPDEVKRSWVPMAICSFYSTTSASLTAELQSTPDVRHSTATASEEEMRVKIANHRRIKDELRRPSSRGKRPTRKQQNGFRALDAVGIKGFPATLSPLKDKAETTNLQSTGSSMNGTADSGSSCSHRRENAEERLSATGGNLVQRQRSADTSPRSTPTSGNTRRLAAVRGSHEQQLNIWPLTEREYYEEPLQATGTEILHPTRRLPASPRCSPPPQRLPEFPVPSASPQPRPSSPAPPEATKPPEIAFQVAAPAANTSQQRRTQLINTYSSSGSKSGAGESRGGAQSRGKETKAADSKYPDPFIGAPPSFQQRLAELSALESETVRFERLKRIRKKPRQEF